MQIITLDVSELEPPQPMVAILAELAEMVPGICLQVHHRREPFPLYEKLANAGFCYKTRQLTEQSFYIYISHQEDKTLLEQLLDSKQ